MTPKKPPRKDSFVHSVINSLLANIAVLDEQGRVIYINKSWEDFARMNGDPELGKTGVGIDYLDTCRRAALDDDLAEQALSGIQRVMKGEIPSFSLEYPCHSPDERRWFQMVVTPGGIQGGGVVISHHNITDRKWAELQLVRARDEWERTFDAVPDLIMLVDPDHRVRRANKAMAGRLGLAPQDMVGLNCYEAVHGLDQPPDFCPHVRLLTHGVEHEVEIREARLGGDFLVSVSPIRSPEGELMGSVHVARDITGQKKAEEALRKSHDHLERRVQERTAELRRLSSQLLKAQEEERRLIALELHDGIGQTLSAVKFRVESTVEYMNQEGLSKAVHALEPLGPMIHEAVEEVRRLQKNLRPSILDDLGILTTISWFCREFETIYPDIRIHQEVMIQEHDVPDPLKIVIFRVLQEALNNIAKHSKAHTVKLSLNRRNSRIHLIIKDSGMGFDVDHALSIGEHDRGLGLISMKERTELSGGSFSLESRIGAGTTVRASWPEHGESFGSI